MDIGSWSHRGLTGTGRAAENSGSRHDIGTMGWEWELHAEMARGASPQPWKSRGFSASQKESF